MLETILQIVVIGFFSLLIVGLLGFIASSTVLKWKDRSEQGKNERADIYGQNKQSLAEFYATLNKGESPFDVQTLLLTVMSHPEGQKMIERVAEKAMPTLLQLLPVKKNS